MVWGVSQRGYWDFVAPSISTSCCETRRIGRRLTKNSLIAVFIVMCFLQMLLVSEDAFVFDRRLSRPWYWAARFEALATVIFQHLTANVLGEGGKEVWVWVRISLESLNFSWFGDEDLFVAESSRLVYRVFGQVRLSKEHF